MSGIKEKGGEVETPTLALLGGLPHQHWELMPTKSAESTPAAKTM